MSFISNLFGGSNNSSSSSSSNQNNSLITSTYGSQMTNGTTANNYLQSMLTGTGDTAAANKGYSNYLQQAGYQPAMKAMSKNITGQGAASGLLNSGSTTKSLQSSGAQLNNQYYNSYLNQLSNQSSQGLQAGSLVSSTGQTSSSSSSGQNSNGLLSGIGSVASGIASIFSDRRLKTDIEKIGEAADGLGWYSFRYVWDKSKEIRGVMADEVSKLRPWALGPVVEGFATVNYGAL